MRRPSFWRVFLHLASAFYMLFLVSTLSIGPHSSPWDMVLFFLLVYTGAALAAGLPEATAAGWWGRGVYYVAFLFWLYLFNLAIATRRSGRVAAEPEEMPRPRPRRRCSTEVPRAAVPGLTLFREIFYVILRSRKIPVSS